MIDYRYSEISEYDIKHVFERTRAKKYRTIDLEATYFYAENDEEPDMFMHHLKVTVYEVKHNILTDRMKKDFLQYAKRWDKGEFQPDIMPGDIPLIQKDIDFVRSVLKDQRNLTIFKANRLNGSPKA